MMTVSRRISTLLLLAAYAVAGVAGVAHLEHHHHHKPILLQDADAASAETAGTHHECSCSHHPHGESSSKSCDAGADGHSGGPACPHDHDDGDCPICQSLAQKPIPAAIVAIVLSPEIVFDRPENPAVSPETPPVTLPVSRGPPVQG